MVNIWMLTTIAGFGMSIILLVMIAMTLMMYPSILVILTAKRWVWEIEGDGDMEAKKATAIGGAYKTKNGFYFYEKKDKLSFHNKSCILAHKASDSKAIRPEIQPVLSLMKKLNVDTREKLFAILEAPLISLDKYETMYKNTPAGSEANE